MKVKLTPHAAELLESMQAHRGEPAELIVEHALEAFAQEQALEGDTHTDEARRQAVRDMLDFVRRNRVHLGPGTSVKDLIREGHRV